jgi:4-amino-4-deoxy-L-arabinose transferase-like glycosyltransferase
MTLHRSVSWLDAIAASRLRSMLVLILFGFTLYLPGITTLQPMDRDEPRFAQASKQMIESGDLIDIRFQDEARHKKPVGIYWLQVAVVKAATAIGVPDAIHKIELYRIPSFMGALASMLFTYLIGLRLMSARAAFLAAALFGATILIGVEARLAKTDAVLAATIIASMLVLAEARFGGRDQLPTLWWVGFWFALGIGILVKGPITPLIVAFAALGTALFGGEGFGFLRKLQARKGILIVIAMVLPWFIAIMVKSGGSFLADSVGQDMLAKVAQGQESHGAPPGTYMAVFAGTAWPLAPFFFLAIPFIWRARSNPRLVFLLSWALPMWVIFEIVPTKLPHYVLPLYPALALATGLALEHMSAPKRWLSKAIPVLLPLPVLILAVGVPIAGFVMARSIPYIATALLVIALVPAFYAMRALWQGAVERAVPLACLASLVIAVAAFRFALPGFEPIRLSPRLALAIEGLNCQDPALATTVYREPSLVFLTRTDLVMTDGRGAADFMKGEGCRAAFVEARAEEAFRTGLAEKGLTPRLATRIAGINMNGGRKLDIGVYVIGENK